MALSKYDSMDPEIEENFIHKLLVVQELQGKIKTTNKSINFFFFNYQHNTPLVFFIIK